MVADIEELEEMDASELHAKTTQCKGSDANKNFIFPVQDGTLKIS